MSSFLDSNVLLYLLASGPKSLRARELLGQGGTISVQVLNEFVAVARRKLKLRFEDIESGLELVRAHCEVADLTLAVHERAVEFAKSTNIEIYDCNIIAAAELSGCDVLYTEDLNHGQRVGGVTIRNPFA